MNKEAFFILLCGVSVIGKMLNRIYNVPIRKGRKRGQNDTKQTIYENQN